MNEGLLKMPLPDLSNNRAPDADGAACVVGAGGAVAAALVTVTVAVRVTVTVGAAAVAARAGAVSVMVTAGVPWDSGCA